MVAATLSGTMRALGRMLALLIAAVSLAACGGSQAGDSGNGDVGQSKVTGAMTTMEFQVELCESDGTCEGHYQDTEIELLVNGEPWSGDPVVTADSPLGPYRAIIEVPGDAVLTVTPVGTAPDMTGDTTEIAVSEISTGTCSDMSTCPVLIVTLREQ